MYKDDQLDEYFNENGGFLPNKVAEEILQYGCYKTPRTITGGYVIWYYDVLEGIWRPYGISDIEEYVEVRFRNRYKPFMGNQVADCIRAKTYIDREEFSCPPHLIVTEFDTLNMETRTREPHNPLNYAKNKLPVDYDEKAECPAIDKFFREIYPENPDILYEIVGYCLWKAMPYHKFFILLGGGRNGKGTFINLIKEFLGKDNVSSISLQDLDGNRFAIAQLYGKMANLCNDIPSNPLKYTGKLKQLTAGDLITAEHKNQQPFQFENYAKLIFSCNTLPPTYDDTDAFYRRQVVLEFKQEFIEGVNADPDLIKKLTTPQELSGLLNRALEALDRVLKQNEFTGVKSIEERKQDYTIKSNPAKYFLENCVEQDESVNYVTKSDLYDAYVSWCHENGHKPTSQSAFSSQARMWLPYISEGRCRVKGEVVRVWYGIRVNVNAVNADPRFLNSNSHKPSKGSRSGVRKGRHSVHSVHTLEDTPDEEIEKKPQPKEAGK